METRLVNGADLLLPAEALHFANSASSALDAFEARDGFQQTPHQHHPKEHHHHHHHHQKEPAYDDGPDATTPFKWTARTIAAAVAASVVR